MYIYDTLVGSGIVGAGVVVAVSTDIVSVVYSISEMNNIVTI